MKRLPSIWLIFMSIVWMFHSSIEGTAATTRGLSSAMQLEADLHRWASENTSKEAASEIFDEDGKLLLGGEHPTWTFREMIEDIATDAVPQSWPGLVGFVLGVIGLFWGRTAKEKQLQNKSRHPTA
jgi:hypothetical protein